MTACAFCGDPIVPSLVFGRVPLGRKRRLHEACKHKAKAQGKGLRRDDLRADQIDRLFMFVKARAQYARRVAS